MKALCSALLDCLVLPLQDKLEEWKKIGHTLDKEHSKEFKKLRTELKKKSDNASRLIKKQKKYKGSAADPKVEQCLAEASKQAATLQEVEKCAVRRVLIEERSRYCTFISCLKPVLSEEMSMVAEFQQLEEVLVKLDKHTEDPFKLPEASEQVLNDIKTSSGGIVFQTPPSSPSSLGSRKSSMCSISSAGSSSGGSSNSPSHQLNKNRQGVNNIVGPMRLSSISSQDSGFTSQDTLFLRPGSPHRNKTPNGSDQELSGSGGSTPGGGTAGWPGLAQPAGRGNLAAGIPGPPLTDRPHTISSAYEKGGQHQRPALQPYTFNPPERIHEEDERPGSGSCDYDDTASTYSSGAGQKPPVPQRLSSNSRPSVPSKPVQFNTNGVPTFSCNQPDMVVPQPVYMNMADMNSMAEARAANKTAGSNPDDGIDLKTPTAEDLGGVGAEANEMADGYCNGKYNASPSRPAAGYQHQFSAPQPNRTPPRGQNIMRPFSFESPNQNGINGRGTILRRSLSQSCGDKSGGQPAPPPQQHHQVQQHRNSAQSTHEQVSGGGEETENCGGSNNTTPRGSMEFLPPPPPHLLHSDEETEMPPPPPAESPSPGMSVAESVRQIQQKQQHMYTPNNNNAGGGGRPGSPATLRRVQSMSAASPNNYHAHQKNEQRASIKARLEASLASPRGILMRPKSPANNSGGEVIYAPVAALQQKISAQQKSKLAAGHTQPGMIPHPPGPVIQEQMQMSHKPTNSFHTPPQQQHHNQPQHLNHQQQLHNNQQQQLHNNQQQQLHNNQQQQLLNNQQQQHHNNQQHNNYHGQQHQNQMYQQQQHYDQHGGGEYGFGMQFQVSANQWYNNHQPQLQPQHYNQQQQQHYTMHNHDQIMQEMDPTLGQRPQPPSLHTNGSTAGGRQSFDATGGGGAGSAQKVRQWIETRTVADVRKIRPILNQEIQSGFSLRKTIGVNDRSMPRF